MNFTNLKPFEQLSVFVESNGYLYDLHNNADFINIIYDIKSRKLTLVWQYPGDWLLNRSALIDEELFVKKNDLQDKRLRKIALIFETVSLLEVKPRDPEIPFSEDGCLGSINVDTENNEINELMFEFIGGMEIRIQAGPISFNSDYSI